MNDDLGRLVDDIAEDVGLSGVVRIDIDGTIACQRAYGLANRAVGIANTVDMQYAIASGAKGFTALTVMSLVETGQLTLDTTARSVLGNDLPLIDDRVTVEHLLSHRSGIGDYLDESVEHDDDEYLMPVPVHELATTEQYVRVLDGHPTKFEPGERFEYCNGSYVVLALLAERVSGVSFHDLVQQRVCDPAGMADTSFLRSDELPGRAAIGYLANEGLRTNVFHLPVRGNGDGGIYTTVADIHALWDAFFAGRIVAPDTVEMMLQPRGSELEESLQFGLGFWLDVSTAGVLIRGFDSGATFVSERRRADGCTFTVITNTSRGSWQVNRRLGALLTSRDQ